ncbi:MAG: nucleoside hydrolase [Armatimonadota bacterium]|nr:nucleoside hydrolase [Armatimonadota bacterium]MCX7777740.1 nucleoside hydrolase [Armatimonadota bacterium]MDW8026205.1 nucleoside hydrolase [Armatimonadota bacterium]
MAENNRGRIKVLLDTDIGSDIDDALCLAYLLMQPRCELIGITTVTGEPEKRAMLASAICNAAGKTDIPIKPGSPKPLLIEQRQKTAPQAEVLSRWKHSADMPRFEAVQFMREIIRSYPNEVTLLTVGPLTNIGLLFAMDPEIPTMLNQLVMMCGVYKIGKREWNAIVDPHATAIVFNTPVRAVLAVGLDVTTRCAMSAEEFRKRFHGSPLLNLIREMAEVWFKGTQRVVFHDPLAASLIFEPEICKYESGRITVNLKDGDALGETTFHPNGGGGHKIATDVDVGRFFEHYFTVVK